MTSNFQIQQCKIYFLWDILKLKQAFFKRKGNVCTELVELAFISCDFVEQHTGREKKALN